MFLPAVDIAVKSLVVGLHPHILFGIDIETVDTTDDTIFRQLLGWVPHRTLGLRIEERIVHALPQPESSGSVLEDLVYVVATQCRRIVRVRIVGAESVAVIAVQTVRRADPHEPLRILIDTVDSRV